MKRQLGPVSSKSEDHNSVCRPSRCAKIILIHNCSSPYHVKFLVLQVHAVTPIFWMQGDGTWTVIALAFSAASGKVRAKQNSS